MCQCSGPDINVLSWGTSKFFFYVSHLAKIKILWFIPILFIKILSNAQILFVTASSSLFVIFTGVFLKADFFFC